MRSKLTSKLNENLKKLLEIQNVTTQRIYGKYKADEIKPVNSRMSTSDFYKIILNKQPLKTKPYLELL